MRIVRPVVCLAVVGSLVGAGTAGAVVKKPVVKPSCNLVTDAAGDSAVPGDDSLDIVGADIASNTKSFTTVIRVKSIGAKSLSQLGKELQIQFDLPGAEARVWMGYTNSVYGGDMFQYGLIGKGTGGAVTSPTGDAVGIIDTAKTEVRMTVPVGDMNALGKATPGAKVTNITVSASQLIGVSPNATGTYAYNVFDADDAAGTKTYVAGNPSCVKPGK
jgi:hypothetical protein